MALVTGASSGLGRELARLLVVERNMTVLATGRDLAKLETLRDSLPGGSVAILAGDLADPAFRGELWAWAEGFGDLDLLINNAGLGNHADFADQDFEAIRAIVEVNLIALIDLTQRASRPMRLRGTGQILQISSTVGFVGMPYAAVYVATKHAVNGLVKTLRYELEGTGVQVRAACPGRIRTDFRARALGPVRTDHARLAGEPVERVARGIIRKLDGRGGFFSPTFSAWGIVQLAHWLPGPFEWFMGRWARGHFAREIGRDPG